MRNPTNLTHAELASIVSKIRDWMYLDLVNDADTYNPEKAWNAGDFAMDTGELFSEHGLAPESRGDKPEASVPSSPPRIVIIVSGGLVQGIFCSDVTAEAVVVDWDTEGGDTEDRDDNIVAVTGENNRTYYAAVLQHHVASFQELAGSNTLVALQQAGIAERVVSGCRTEVAGYVLFDFDMGNLATTHVYKDQAESAEDASQLDNVIVLPLVLETVTCPTGRREE